MEDLIQIIAESVLTILGIVIAAAVSYFAPKLKRRLDILADKDNSGIVEMVSDMAVELAEKELKGEKGEAKFMNATNYVAVMLSRYGIDATSEFVAGAVQNGWRRMKEKQKEENNNEN